MTQATWRRPERRARERRPRRAWVRLDNASNIFLAARSDIDPKVFRLGAEMDADIDVALLQEALDETFDRWPLYHAVLRRGVFWHYLQDSDLRPLVASETLQTVAPLYRPGRPSLLFRVVHHRRRISLEVFHALSDGTGALWFLMDLLAAYARRRHPEDPFDPIADSIEPAMKDLVGDSFAHHFRRPFETREPQAFERAAAPAVLTVGTEPEPLAVPALRPPEGRRRVHRVRGTRTPDHRTRAVELSMPAADVLALARAERVSITMYLTALLVDAVRRTAPSPQGARTVAASIPVNLRQFFPSASGRNFFSTVRIEHTSADPAHQDLGAMARELEAQFRPQTAPAALAGRLARLIAVERSPVLRVIPRPLKDLILGRINDLSNRRLTIAGSNLGRVVLPEPAESHVRRMTFHVSAVRPQFCAISHAGELMVTFTSPFTQVEHVREVARTLTRRGIDVRVAAARVTEAELAEAAT